MKKIFLTLFTFLTIWAILPIESIAQQSIKNGDALPHQDSYPETYTIFDDKMLLDGYAEKYAKLPKEILLEMIKDETLNSYRTAAAVRRRCDH